MVSTARLNYPEAFKTFTDEDGIAWLWVEDQQRAGFYDRWGKAEVIVATNGVVRTPSGEHYVQSQGDAQLQYLVQDVLKTPNCTCKDFANSIVGKGKGAPHGWCKHALAAWITEQRPQREGTAPRLLQTQKENNTMNTEARVSWNARYTRDGFDQQITLRGEDEAEVLERAKKVMASLTVTPVQPASLEQPQQTARANPICQKCSGNDTVYITWEGSATRAAGGAWKCTPCTNDLRRADPNSTKSAWVKLPKAA